MRVLLWCIAVAVMAPPCPAASVSEDDVLLIEEIENFGQTVGLEPVGMEDASGKIAMALGGPQSSAQGAVKLPPGKYTVLVSVWAPAGDQDGFFVDIRDRRDRRVPPGQRAWHTLAYDLQTTTEEIVPISVIVQEVGLRVDQIAVVKGTLKTDEVRAIDVPTAKMQGVQMSLDELPRLVSTAVLASVPDAPFVENEDTVAHLDFEADIQGATGASEVAEGRFGRGLYLGAPDGRLVLELSDPGLGAAGTVEFWVRPRPAQRLWWDQGWHYFLHLEPAAEAPAEAVSIGLSRHPGTQLQLSARGLQSPPGEAISIATGSASIEDWHHLLVSWDFSAKPQYLWLLLDGVGKQVHFTPWITGAPFRRIEIGNAPLSGGLPYLQLDGTVDEVLVSRRSVKSRLGR